MNHRESRTKHGKSNLVVWVLPKWSDPSLHTSICLVSNPEEERRNYIYYELVLTSTTLKNITSSVTMAISTEGKVLCSKRHTNVACPSIYPFTCVTLD
jgi:hypothetical protein